MKLLPAAGAERTRLFVLLGLLVVAGFAAWQMSGSDSANGTSTTTTATPASNLTGATGQGSAQAGKPGAKPTISSTPEALRLAKLEEVPDEPSSDRNPFRFGAKKLPPQPAPVFTPAPAPILTPTGPPPIPPVPLQLKGVMTDPYGKNRAYLTDAAGNMFEVVDNQIVDGRYRVLKVGIRDVVVAYLDGSGQRTLFQR